MTVSRWLFAVALSASAGIASAADLCAINPYTKAEAQAGKVAFDSHCALCHQYSMTGRTIGNYQNESPDIKLLSASDLKFLDGNGGSAPPLIGPTFFKKQQHNTLLEFTTQVGGAANSFPTEKFQTPKTYLLLAAYVLYRNCGKL